VSWLSSHYRADVETWLLNRQCPETTVFESRAELLSSRPDAAIVCTASSAHFDDTMWLLRQGIPVLVEKPLALEERSARKAVLEARRRGAILCVCLPLAVANYIRAIILKHAARGVKRVDIDWFDPTSEVRYGETKGTDFTTHRVDEVIPHLWSLLKLLLGEGPLLLVSVSSEPPDTVRVRCEANGVEIEALFGRHSPARKRRLGVSFIDGGRLDIDFTVEPGTIVVDGLGVETAADETAIRPLTAVQRAFFTAVEMGKPSIAGLLDAARSLESIRLAQSVRSITVAQDAVRLANLLADPGDPLMVQALLFENIGSEDLRVGRYLKRHAGAEKGRLICDAIVSGLKVHGTSSGQNAIGEGWEIDDAIGKSAFLQAVRTELARQR
jgi:predicted dehydrogenase